MGLFGWWVAYRIATRGRRRRKRESRALEDARRHAPRVVELDLADVSAVIGVDVEELALIDMSETCHECGWELAEHLVLEEEGILDCP